VTGAMTNRGLLRAVLVGFALLEAWRFLAEVAGILSTVLHPGLAAP
jgi:hypothetical protein